MTSYLENYRSEISDIIEKNDTNHRGPDKKWGELETGHTKSGTIPEQFYLVKSEWSQGKFFNDFCPEDEAMVSPAYNGHVPAGCAAVVMAQVMHYWAWPSAGTGENCYTPSANSQYGEQCADFGNASYNFSAMAAQLNEASNEVAELVYHAAVSVKTNFSPGGSSAFSSITAKALKNNFRFSEKTEFVYKSAYNDTEWVDLLKKHLDNGVPLYYRGDKEGKSAHAFICDGYDQANRFHFNWGWNGRCNGYYALTAMDPLTNYNYSSNQGAIINLFPANDDFTIEGLAADNTSVEKGRSLKFSFEHVYTGADFSDTPVLSGCWLSSDPFLSDDDIFIGANEALLSSENDRASIARDYVIPESVECGDYYILAFANSNNDKTEIDESNNLKGVKITVKEAEEESDIKSSFACSDDLEPNNSETDAFYIGEETGYFSSSLCLTEGDEDWFEFILNSEAYYVKIATSEKSKNGYYGLEFIFTSGGVEIQTFETDGATDTKIWLYDSDMNLIAEDDNGGENLFARLMYRPLFSTTASAVFNESNFNLYPNPVKGKVFINADIRFEEEVTIVLMDMRGSLIEKKTLQNIRGGGASLDMTPYSDGQYLIGIYAPNGDYITKKILKNSMM